MDTMGIGEFGEQAQNLLSGHEEQAEAVIEKGEDLAKDHLPDQADSAIEGAAEQAKDFLQ
jgi:MT0933-like antitoxin protein